MQKCFDIQRKRLEWQKKRANEQETTFWRICIKLPGSFFAKAKNGNLKCTKEELGSDHTVILKPDEPLKGLKYPTKPGIKF